MSNDTKQATFSDLYAAIAELPYGALRDELFALWFSLEDHDSADALAKFDANVGDLSPQANAFWQVWAA